MGIPLVPGLTLTREGCRAQAQAIGPATAALVGTLLDAWPVDRLRVAGRMLRLAHTFSATRLEQACARAGHFGEGDYATVKRLLQQGLEPEPLEPAAPAAPAAGGGATAETALAAGRYTFVRHASEFVAGLFGGSAGASAARGASGGAQ